MNKTFIEKVRGGEIKSPTQRGFDIQKWDKEWEKTKNKESIKSENLYKMGKIIDSVLSELRIKLDYLYKINEIDNIDNEKMMMAFFALSNGEQLIIAETINKVSNGSSIFSTTVDTECNKLTLEEESISSVDSLGKAIWFCKERLNKEKDLKGIEKKLPSIDLIIKESRISELYGMYEEMWQAFIWGDFELIEINNQQKKYGVIQVNSELNISAEISQIRKQRLAYETIAILAANPSFTHFFNKDKCLIIKKEGKKEVLKSVGISSLDKNIQIFNSNWRVTTVYLEDNFPKEFLTHEYDNGFNISDALNVLRCLMLLSHQYMNRYPEDDSFKDLKKLLAFCPRLKKNCLIRGLRDALGYSTDKISKILNFIEYDVPKKESKCNKRKDLWCYPIVLLNDGNYIFLTGALTSIVITRVVEHWLEYLDIDLQKKGETYEKIIINNLNNAVRSNELITDYNEGVSKRIKLFPDKEEEIDLIIRVGNTILIGEAKSIVTTDSPISQYRTLERLREASSQVKRKLKFVKENLEAVFSNLNWSYDKNRIYYFVSCILNSSRMFVGYCVDEIPICDEQILTTYFTSNKIPFLSTIEQNEKKHLAWFNLYNNFGELQNNMDVYLKNPPQIYSKSSFKYAPTIIPSISHNSYNISYIRLIPENINLQEHLKKKYIFSLQTVENIEQEIEQFDVSV